MKWYEWIEKAKGYAENILDGYCELCRLDSKNQKNSKEYQACFENLKNMIECERIFYSLMDIYELEFIHERLMNKEEVSIIYSLPTMMLQIMDIIPLETLEWDRVYKNIVWHKTIKEYPTLSTDTKQIGMIALLPYEETDDYVHYLSKIAIIEGRFHMEFTKVVLNNQKYPANKRNSFLYFSSYIDQNVENYYLQTKFEWNSEKVDFILNTYAGWYWNDSKQYCDYCLDKYKREYLPYIKEILQYSREALNENDFLSLEISIVSDTVYSFLKVVPYHLMKKFYENLSNLQGEVAIKNYLLEKLRPLVYEQEEKNKEYCKK